MRPTASYWSNFYGRLAACLVLLVVVSLLVGARPSGAAVGTQGFPVATGAENETSVAVSGNTAVWSISRAGGDIQGKNLTTGQDLNIPSEPDGQVRPSVGGRIVVWEDTSSGDSDVYGYDLVTRQKFAVAVGPEGEDTNQANPIVSGNLVVWEDDRNGNWDIYSFNLDTGQESPVTMAPGNQRSPVVSGETVVWEQRSAIDSDVVSKNVGTGEQKIIASGSDWQDSPAISDSTVVWVEDRLLGNDDVYGHDLAEDREFEVAVGPGDQHSPSVAGRVAVWVDDPGGAADVRGRDLSTGEAFLAAGGSAQQENPVASGDKVFWEAQRTGENGFGSFDLYGTRLDLAPLAPAGLTASNPAGGVELDWAQSPEDDLAGYNVYRAGSEGGAYTKLNAQGPIFPASFFNDSGAPRGARSFYKVTAVDAAGSESAAARISAVNPETSEISLQSDLQVLEIGAPVTLSGRLTSNGVPLANEPVVLESRPIGASGFAPVTGGQLTTDATGGFSLAGLRPEKSADYRARFTSGAEEVRSSESALTRVDVKQLVSLNVSTNTLKLRRSLILSGTVFPAKSGQVKLTIKRGGVVVSEQVANVSSSRFALGYRPTAVGTYEVSATLVDYPSNLASPAVKRFRVIR